MVLREDMFNQQGGSAKVTLVTISFFTLCRGAYLNAPKSRGKEGIEWANVEEGAELMIILGEYELASGQKVNISKCSVSFEP
ncbi:hypothetical protein LIER_29159 [Lithospermum erythrorhizon]|uniref:Uncharacterized protein n=1 Tax=Lithospermum erythrorhizon TaxID=34254 RepID=A0AAV3RI96_LITER